MPIPQLYYIDTPSFNTATRVYLDPLQTVCAPDAFYSDGVSIRKQVNCNLLPAEVCPTCLPDCGTSITGTGGQGYYKLEFGTGATLGAIIIRFNPQGVPDGIRASLSGSTNIYNRVAALAFSGGVQTPLIGNFTIIGASSAGSCIPPGIVSYNEFIYNSTTSSFDPTGGLLNYTITAPDIFLTPSAPGFTTLVIPKVNLSNNVLLVEILGPCSTTAWNIQVNCPVTLTSFLRSTVASTFNEACTLSLNRRYYFVSVAPTPSLTDVGLSDYVFNDQNGAFPLPNGFYKVENAGSFEVIEVLNGNVINLYNCP